MKQWMDGVFFSVAFLETASISAGDRKLETCQRGVPTTNLQKHQEPGDHPLYSGLLTLAPTRDITQANPEPVCSGARSCATGPWREEGPGLWLAAGAVASVEGKSWPHSSGFLDAHSLQASAFLTLLGNQCSDLLIPSRVNIY